MKTSLSFPRFAGAPVVSAKTPPVGDRVPMKAGVPHSVSVSLRTLLASAVALFALNGCAGQQITPTVPRSSTLESEPPTLSPETPGPTVSASSGEQRQPIVDVLPALARRAHATRSRAGCEALNTESAFQGPNRAVFVRERVIDDAGIQTDAQRCLVQGEVDQYTQALVHAAFVPYQSYESLEACLPGAERKTVLVDGAGVRLRMDGCLPRRHASPPIASVIRALERAESPDMDLMLAPLRGGLESANNPQ